MLSVLFQKQDVKNQKERMELLRKLAVQQLQTLEKVSLMKGLIPQLCWGEWSKQERVRY